MPQLLRVGLGPGNRGEFAGGGVVFPENIYHPQHLDAPHGVAGFSGIDLVSELGTPRAGRADSSDAYTYLDAPEGEFTPAPSGHVSHELIIDAAQIPGTATLAGFVLMLKEGCFPSGMLDLDGTAPCASDGSDIWFSENSDGTSVLPHELIHISLNNNPALSQLRIAVKTVDQVDGDTNGSIYVNWGDTPPTYTPTAVWDLSAIATGYDYEAVFHGRTLEDSTGLCGDLTGTGTTSAAHATAVFDSSYSYALGSNLAATATHLNNNNNPHNIEFIWDPVTREGSGWIFHKSQSGAGVPGFIIACAAATDNMEVLQEGIALKGFNSAFTGGAANRHHISLQPNGALSAIAYNRNGSAISDNGTSTFGSGNVDDSSYPLRIGGGASGFQTAGNMEELRIYLGTAKSADWLLAEYNNLFNPDTFVSPA